jgi:predicted RecB family nuclease
MREMKAFDNNSGHVTLLASVTPPAREKNFPSIHSIKVLRDATGLNDFGETSRIRARVWLSKKPELLNPSTPFDLPEFDVEVDIDLENSMKSFQDSGEADIPGKDRVYLYGVGLHDRTINPDWHSAKIESIYNFDNSDEAEYEVLLRTWDLLHKIVKECEGHGKSVGIFHYSFHEKTWWRNFASQHAGKPDVPTEDQVDLFVSKYFVDLLDFTRQISFPTTGKGIKKLAPLAKFKWAVEDPGGDTSLLKYKQSVDQSSTEAERQAARNWLISYNRDDVRATYAVRDYVRSLRL